MGGNSFIIFNRIHDTKKERKNIVDVFTQQNWKDTYKEKQFELEFKKRWSIFFFPLSLLTSNRILVEI